MTPPPQRHTAAARLLILAIAATFGATACSQGPSTPGAGIGRVTLPRETLAFPSATAAPRTTKPPLATLPAETSPNPNGGSPTTADAPGTTPPSTTEVVLAQCDLNVVLTDIGPADEGYTFADLRCSGPWGTVVAKALDPSVGRDELVVMRAQDGQWGVEAAGGDTSCTSAAVPAESFIDLACGRWERPP